MTWLRKYLLAAVAIAVLVHFAIVISVPGVLMGAALERLGAGRPNQWRFSDRVTPSSRTIVRPSPDFAYSACPYDLGQGPVVLHVAAWNAYWSLSLYADNSDNYFTLNDREARQGGEVVLLRRGAGGAPDGAEHIAQSPSRRGIALIRRLAPTAESYAAAARVAREDVCARLATLSAAH